LYVAIENYQVDVLIINDSKKKDLILPVNFSSFRVLNNPKQGVASARNFGASQTASDVIWFLDDDIWINEKVLERGLELINNFPSAIFNFNWVYPDYLNEQIQQKPFGRYLHKIEFTTMKGWSRGNAWDDFNLFKTQNLAGATLLLKKNTFEKVDGYNSSFPLAGFEDYDFSKRVQLKNIDCYIDPVNLVYHNEVNKTSLAGFLKRVKNNSITRRHAVEIGYSDQQLNFSMLKKMFYKTLYIFDVVLLKFDDIWPNISLLDKFYFIYCKAMIGLYSFKGYNSLK
jgi:predicted glycosyltransferase involved in capsule biosynthesis